MATKPQATPLVPGARPWQRRRGRPRLSRTPLGLTLWRHKLFLCCVAVCAVALTSVYVRHAPALYEAETLLLLGEPDGGSDLPADLAVAVARSGPEGVAEAIRSEAMAIRLMEALSLHLLPEFNPTLQADAGGLQRWFDPARLVPNSVFNRLPGGLQEALSPRGSMSDQEQAASLRDLVIAETRGRIVAEPTDRAAVIRIRFSSTDPQLAELGANTLADLYLSDRLAAEQAVSGKAAAFLLGEIAELRARIADTVLAELAGRVAALELGGVPPEPERALHADREVLRTYGERLSDIELQLLAQEPDARVISVATTPDQPVNGHQELTFITALAAALLLGALGALALDRLDSTITSAEQLGSLRLSPLGALPTIPRPRDQRRPLDRHILDYPDAPFGQAVAALRSGLIRSNAIARRTTVLLVAAQADEGTTTTALSLARCHARAGGTALLVDCDLQRPRLETLTGVGQKDGLADVLLDHRDLADVLRRDERSGMRFITAGNDPSGARDLLGSDAMRALLREVAAEYDLVILDGSPVLAGGEACALAQVADGTVLLARWGSTRRDDVTAAAEMLIGAGADMAGLVLNCAKPKKAAAEAFDKAVPRAT